MAPGDEHRLAEARRPSRVARAAFWTAGLLGTVHAGWSAYWAFGGRFLLDTVGRWAVDAADAQPRAAFALLISIAVVKVLAAWIPLLADTGRLPGRRIWRAIGWTGGSLLFLYGTVNAVAGVAALSGWLGRGGSDRAGLIGHAFLWDPLFALWGAALTLALALTREPSAARRSP